jgi:hypothetical protein
MTTFDLATASESLTFGVEIETSGRSRIQVATALAAAFPGWTVQRSGGYYDVETVVMPDGRKWSCMTDGSIIGEGTEVVSPILQGAADLALLQEVVRVVRETGAKSSAALGCGIHVHVGVRHLSAGQIGRLAKVVSKADGMIRTAVKVSESRARWCAPLGESYATACGKATSMEELAAAWYGGRDAARYAPAEHYHQSRYRGLNLHSVFYRANHGSTAARGTVEFRYFDGTLHAGEIKSYVQLALALVCYAERSKAASAKAMAVHARGPLASWRQFMLTLGLKGEAYATARLHLTKHFPKEVQVARVAPVAAPVVTLPAVAAAE